jgi:LDH2 family malate/lactate/ureidoglycolate dehydrogenase
VTAVARVPPAVLAEHVTRLFTAAGLPPADAAACAAQTVDAEVRGVASHGCVACASSSTGCAAAP